MNSRDNSDNYICRTATELPAYMQAKIRVPEGIEITAGEIFMAENLDTDLGYGNWDVYIPDTIESETVIPVIVINNSFETLPDGRRPKGNPDYTTYVYKEDEVITTIRLLPEIKFELSPDNFSNFEEFEAALEEGEENIVGTYLFPDIGTNDLKWTESIEDVETKVYLYIEALKWFRLGGLFGGDFARTLVVRVKNNQSIGAPAITSFTITPVEGLIEGEDNVEPDAVVANMVAEGGTEPYSYEFNNGVSGVDNGSFVIDGTSIKVGESALTTKNYRISVKVTDSEEQTRIANAVISVSAPEITSVEVAPESNLVSPINVDTKVAEVSTVGGIAPYVYTLAQGVGDNNLFKVNGSSIEAASQLTEVRTYNITVTSTDKNGKTMNGTGEIVVAAPEITDLVVAPVGEIEVPTSVGTKVADLATLGGTAPYTYSLTLDTGDNDMFEISGAEVLVKTQLTELRDYTISVDVEDANGKTESASATLHTSSASMTGLTINVVSGLQEGNENVATGATVATLEGQGGNPPYTYSFEEGGADNDKFTISGSNVNVGTNALTEGSYSINVRADDTYDKTIANIATIVVSAAPAPEITSINADITPDLRVGEDNVATGATIITMTAEGGTPPITFAFKEDSSLGVDNASFVIEDNIIKVGSAALTEAKTYKVYVEASDTEGKTYDEGFDIPVSEAYPNITAVTITPTEGLTAPVSANTVVATLSATGGTAPYTYTLVDEALDNNEFQISGNEVTNIAEIDLASNKHIQVLATDSVGKTLEETGEIVVS